MPPKPVPKPEPKALGLSSVGVAVVGLIWLVCVCFFGLVLGGGFFGLFFFGLIWLVCVFFFVSGCFLGFRKFIQGGPKKPVNYTWSDGAPISRHITPGKPIYFRPFIGVLSPFMTGRG